MKLQTKNPTWTISGDSIVSNEGKKLGLFPHEFWYLAPCRTTFSPEEQNVSFSDFAVVLHNAVVGNGLVVSMQTLLMDLPLSTVKRGVAAEAEALLEEIRLREYLWDFGNADIIPNSNSAPSSNYWKGLIKSLYRYCFEEEKNPPHSDFWVQPSHSGTYSFFQSLMDFLYAGRMSRLTTHS